MNFQNSIITSLCLIGLAVPGIAQVAINTDGSDPDVSAMLDVASIDKGLLLPRLSTSQRDLISDPANGLVIYNTDSNTFEYFDGSGWEPLGSSELDPVLRGVQSILGPNVLPDIDASNSIGITPDVSSADVSAGGWQSFEAEGDGAVQSVELQFDVGPTDSHTITSLRIYASEAADSPFSGTLLHSQSNIAAVGPVVSIPIGPPVSIVEGQRYYLYVEADAPWALRTSDAYSDGRASTSSTDDFGFSIAVRRPLNLVRADDGIVIGGYGTGLALDPFAGEISLSGDTFIGGNLSVEGDSIFAGSLTIEGGGNSYTLPPADGADGQILSTDGNGSLVWADASGGIAQNLGSSASGDDRTITISSGTGTTISVADGDSDATNEWQSLSLFGSELSISDGNSVDLSTLTQLTTLGIGSPLYEPFRNEGSGDQTINYYNVRQSFRSPSVPRRLVGVRVSILADSETLSGDLRIFDSNENSLLYTQAYTATGDSFYTITLDDPLLLESNREYILDFFPTGSANQRYVITTGDAYPDGAIIDSIDGHDLEFALLYEANVDFGEDGIITFPDGSTLTSSQLILDDGFLRLAGSNQSVDLSVLNSDGQELELNGDLLSITDGNDVDLSQYRTPENYSGESVTLGYPATEVYIEGDSTTYTYYGGPQSFRAVSGLPITEVHFSITPDSETLSGTLRIRDRDTGTILHTQAYTSNGDRFYPVILSSPVPVQAGGNYEVFFDPGPNMDHTYRVHSENSYDGGYFISENLQYDLEFAIIVDTEGQMSLAGGGITFADGSTLNSSHLTFDGSQLGISGTGQTVDLSQLGTAPQTLGLTANILSISDGNSVDLSGYIDAPQTLSLSGNTLTLSEGGTVDLSGYADVAQTLSLSGNTLTLSNGGTVDLSGYIDALQTLSLTGNTLTLSEGGTVDLSGYIDAPQTLSLSANTLTLSDGGTVDLSGYADVAQTLSYSSGTLSIAGGNSVSLNAFSGDIGIGTTSPDSMLHVSSVSSTGETDDGITLTQGSFNSEIFHNTGGDLVIKKRINTDQLVIDEGGGIGIGTNAPTQTLDVNGTVRVRGGSPAAGKVLTATNANGEATWEDKLPYSHSAITLADVDGSSSGWQTTVPGSSQTLSLSAGGV